MDLDIDTGNAHDLDTHGTGWLVGFGPWTVPSASGLRHVPRDQPVAGLCVKWYEHPVGHDSGNDKPVSEGRTISLLVSAEASFRIEFSRTPGFEPEGLRSIVLRREGDYVAWGAGLYHRWHCERRSTIVTVRWNPSA
ncbi:MAG TPA: hypothetical protein VLI46_13465 [Ramlibacter sp.]|nr:hypothetical protein [Ramlibacter sp.]